MPNVVLGFEKKKGGKTIIQNLDDIANALDRSSDEILFFIGQHIGRGISGRAIPGLLTDDDINNILRSFVNIYELCKNCNNPETKYSIHRTYINKKCKACGSIEKMEESKMVRFIIKSTTKTK